MKKNTAKYPLIKICGLTKPDDAEMCMNIGVDMIGCIFFEKSSRNVTEDTAREISDTVAPGCPVIGVFVNETYSFIMKKVEKCRLSAVQLHGIETPELVIRLMKNDIKVIKALFAERKPFFKDISEYNATAFLVECGKGILPGGNAESWNWSSAKSICSGKAPLFLAGGLKSDNIINAVRQAEPDIVDISSGVELSPGIKDKAKVTRFIKNVRSVTYKKQVKSIF